MKTNPSLPVVSAIIERQHEGRTQVLVQTRWKPDRDPVYSGTLEIPAGVIDEYENVYEALKREVLEETGLTIIKIKPDNKTKIYTTGKKDASFGFVPFCCHQQLKNGRPWVGFAFLCEVEDKEELRSVFTNTPEQIFALQLGVLDYYLKSD